MMVARGRLKHQYPHSWRSKKAVIFRNTPQWFIAMDRTSPVPRRRLRARCPRHRCDSGFYPAGRPKNRLRR